HGEEPDRVDAELFETILFPDDGLVALLGGGDRSRPFGGRAAGLRRRRLLFHVGPPRCARALMSGRIIVKRRHCRRSDYEHGEAARFAFGYSYTRRSVSNFQHTNEGDVTMVDESVTVKGSPVRSL